MDSPDIPSRQSPKPDLRGPRPPPLRVRKASHKIRKPPVAPPPPGEAQPSPPPPIIIYTETPRIIHVDPNEFKSVVQQLTGQNMSPPSTSASAFQENNGGISPMTSSESGLHRNSNENSIVRPNYLTPSDSTNTSSPKHVDIFSTLFDL